MENSNIDQWTQAAIDALTVEILNPDYEKNEYKMFILGLKVAIEIIKEINIEFK
jgi:hypothetical protein